jgi:N-alpha-acetyl-L-2,4-diaminobutyrate deacetylase
MIPVPFSLENLVALGAPVGAGQAVGQIHFLERPDHDPVPVTAASAGVLLAARAALVSQGVSKGDGSLFWL